MPLSAGRPFQVVFALFSGKFNHRKIFSPVRSDSASRIIRGAAKMEPEEYLYLHVLLRWERDAPPDRHEGLLDGTFAKNTQTARIVNVLKLVTGLDDQQLKKLERSSERRDGRSYIFKIQAG
jgi:hypothetical protein